MLRPMGLCWNNTIIDDIPEVICPPFELEYSNRFPDIASVYVIDVLAHNVTSLLIKFISISKILAELKWHI
jgi:hypothetical protein